MRAALLIAVVLAARPISAQPVTLELLWSVVSPHSFWDGSFGAVIAVVGDIDGDGTDDLAVGAPEEDVSIYNANGRAYLVSGATGAILHELTGQGDDRARFGDAVVGVGDLNGDGVPDVAVGAPTEGHEPTALGAAYVFSGATGARLFRWTGTIQRGGFGNTLASPGDMTGDGVPDLVLHEAGSFPYLYVVSGAAGTLMRVFDVGGDPLVAAGDVDGDGVPDVVVGGSGSDQAGLYRVLSGETGEVIHAVADPQPGGNPDIRRLAPAGDFDGDGVPEMASSAFRTGTSGRVLVVDGSTGTVLRTLNDPAPRPNESYAFPRGMAAGDADGDGIPDLAVGAYSPTRPGEVYLFSGATGAVLAGPIREPGGPGGRFGEAMAFVREASADAPAVLAVGDLAGGRVHAYSLGAPVASAPPPTPHLLELSVAPVPSSGAATATLSVESAQAVRVVVVDAIGRTVAVVHDGPLGAGRHRLALPSALAPGVYAVRVQASEATATARWVVAR